MGVGSGADPPTRRSLPGTPARYRVVTSSGVGEGEGGVHCAWAQHMAACGGSGLGQRTAVGGGVGVVMAAVIL